VIPWMKQTRFIVMGNVFCSEYRIHKRFDLKGSSHGRTTDKPREEIDETTTLKDLDLNFVFRLEQSWFQELIRYRFSFFYFLGFPFVFSYLRVGPNFYVMAFCLGKSTETVSSWKQRESWITVF